MHCSLLPNCCQMSYFCVAFALASLIAPTFSDDPRKLPQNSTVALGGNGTFICEGSTGLHTIWKVKTEGYSDMCLNTRLAVNNEGIISGLRNRSIFLSRMMIGDDKYSSTIIIGGTMANNLTEVACALEGPDFSQLNYSRAFLRIIGPPTAVIGIQVSARGNRVLLTWQPSFSPFSALVTYHVQVEDADNGTILSHNTTKITSVWFQALEGVCSILVFNIYASNLAGRTKEENINFSDFTKPIIKTKSGFANHNIQLINGEIRCDVEFEPVSGCSPHYPVVYYVLLLKEAASNETYLAVDSSTEPRLIINSSYIARDSVYSYQVQAVNNINISSESEEMIFFTTDVQTPTVQVNPMSVIIRCHFIPGSVSRGCHVKIDGLGISTLTRNLERNAGANSVLQEIEIPEGIGRDVDLNVTVFDWRSDGTIGNLSMPLHIIVDNRGVTTEALMREDGLQKWNSVIVVSSTGVTVIAVLLFIATILTGVVVHKQRLKSRSSGRGMTANVDTQPSNYSLSYDFQSRLWASTLSSPGLVNTDQFPPPAARGHQYSKEYSDGESCIYSQLTRSANSLPPRCAPNYSKLQHFHTTEGRNYEDVRSLSTLSSPIYHHIKCSPPDYSEIDTLGRDTPKIHSTMV